MTPPETDTPTSTPGIDPTRQPPDDEIDVFGLTHLGKIRKVNQDHFMICSLRKHMRVHLTSLPDVDELPIEGERLAYMCMVADGVGSGFGGEEASRMAIERITGYVANSMKCYYTADAHNHEEFSTALEEAAMEVHTGITQVAEADPERRGMATTLTLMISVWPHAYILQVGDSRCYLFRNGKLTQITRDQTMAQELVDQGVLGKTDAGNTRWAHVLSSAIGGMQHAPVVTRLDHGWHTVGLLCSDGLTKHVSDDQIRERLANMTSAKQVCEDLLQDALDDGGSDNVSLIVGRVVHKDPT